MRSLRSLGGDMRSLRSLGGDMSDLFPPPGSGATVGGGGAVGDGGGHRWPGGRPVCFKVSTQFLMEARASSGFLATSSFQNLRIGKP